jgi:hypothetical protein
MMKIIIQKTKLLHSPHEPNFIGAAEVQIFFTPEVWITIREFRIYKDDRGSLFVKTPGRRFFHNGSNVPVFSKIISLPGPIMSEIEQAIISEFTKIYEGSKEDGNEKQ